MHSIQQRAMHATSDRGDQPAQTRRCSSCLSSIEASMASKASAAAVVFLAFNLMFFTLASACGTSCPTPSTPTPTPGSRKGKCPIDALKLSACANVLNGLINVGVGKFPKQPCDCCTVLDGLLDLEAAACLCTAIKGNVLGINLNIPVDLSLVLNYCGKKAPTGFQCF